MATELTKRDALGAHARDELGLDQAMLARPIQAALSSAASFTVGAILPVLAMVIVPSTLLIPSVTVTVLLALVLLGVAGAQAGGAPVIPAAVRVGLGGGFAMAVTAAVGRLVGHAGL